MLGLGLGINKINLMFSGSETSLILDTITAINGYSTSRQLKTSATNAIRVERASDSTQQDIGFVDEELDEVSLLAFTGVSDGIVVTLYDQVGTDHYIATVATGPRVATSGSVVKQDGKPTLDFYYSGQKSMLLTKTISQPFVTNTIATSVSTGNRQLVKNAADLNWRFGFDVGGTFWYAIAGLPISSTVPSSLDQTLISNYFNGASSYVRINQVSTIGDAGTNNAINPTLGSSWRGKISEHIILADDSELSILETNQQLYYSTPFLGDVYVTSDSFKYVTSDSNVYILK